MHYVQVIYFIGLLFISNISEIEISSPYKQPNNTSEQKSLE